MAPALASLIRSRIQTSGPLTLAEYMTECLLHPMHGYYATREPFGSAGDFITAPEISQMFGELLGLSLAQHWLDIGAPSRVVLAEAGPGRGTLMADVLRATRGVPGFHAALEICLIEASPRLRALQGAALPGWQPRWLEGMDQLPDDRPLLFLANEFFDALPIRQFRRAEGPLWEETLVGLSSEGALELGRARAREVDELAHRIPDTTPGEIVEICPAAWPHVAVVAARIRAQGGAALILDYGDWRSRGDTFQALRAHAPTDPLAAPGEADLTAHVDFEALALAAQPLRAGFTTQGALLEALGIEARATRLGQRLAGESLRQHLAALHRLTAPEAMGTLFKALALVPQGMPLPPGFPAVP